MIKTFSHKGLEQFWKEDNKSGLPVQNTKKVIRILDMLQVATIPDAMNVVGWNFHKLKGRRAGTYAVEVTGNWRITFEWEDGPINVNIEDYH